MIKKKEGLVEWVNANPWWVLSVDGHIWLLSEQKYALLNKEVKALLKKNKGVTWKQWIKTKSAINNFSFCDVWEYDYEGWEGRKTGQMAEWSKLSGEANSWWQKGITAEGSVKKWNFLSQKEDNPFFESEVGQFWLLGNWRNLEGQKWLKTEAGRRWIYRFGEDPESPWWINSWPDPNKESTKNWLNSLEYQAFLISEKGAEWLVKTNWGREWLATKKGCDWMKNTGFGWAFSLYLEKRALEEGCLCHGKRYRTIIYIPKKKKNGELCLQKKVIEKIFHDWRSGKRSRREKTYEEMFGTVLWE